MHSSNKSFLRNGFFATLTHHELLLYVFLILVADRNGLSYYNYDKICILLRISVDEYIFARDALIEKDLIACMAIFSRYCRCRKNLALIHVNHLRAGGIWKNMIRLL